MDKKTKSVGSTITLEDQLFDSSNLSVRGKEHLVMLQYVNDQITQKNNELQVADSARIVYVSVLKSSLRLTGE